MTVPPHPSTAAALPYATRRVWDVDDVLPEALLDPGAAPPAPGEHEPRVFQDLVAEYDARLLEAELLRREPDLSAPFRAFLRAWALDEAKHTAVLHRLHRGAFGTDPAALDARLAPRRGDFAPLEPFLEDEFRLGVMLAYDEAMSTHGYGEDIPFYGSLGRTPAQGRAFAGALRQLKNDEAVHYKNAIEFLARVGPGRADEVPAVMEEVVRHDAAQTEYRATFLLDHATEQFDAPTMERVGRAVCRTIQRRIG